MAQRHGFGLYGAGGSGALTSHRSNMSYRVKLNSIQKASESGGYLNLFTGEEQYAMVVNDEQFTLKITSMLLDVAR